MNNQKHIAMLERDADALLALAHAFLKKYPLTSTPGEVLSAVTVPVPLPTFLALLVVAYQIPEKKVDEQEGV